MLSFKVHKLFVTVLVLTLLIVFYAPSETDAKRVIFYSKPSVHKGQLFSTSPKMEPCPRCQVRDYRGRCRRIISFNPDEKC
ncbi:uncharacterized protein ACRADG_007005 [Cochliomyia hominivorax]